MSDRGRPKEPPNPVIVPSDGAPHASSDEEPTARIVKSAIAHLTRTAALRSATGDDIGELTADSMPTVDLPPSEVRYVEFDALHAIESTVELTRDVLPIGLRAAPLPFQTPPEDALDLTTDLAPDAVLQRDVPFVDRPLQPDDTLEPLRFAIHAGAALETPPALTIAQAATIAADAHAGALDATASTRDEWIAAERRWIERIAADLERGDAALRDAYDDAFLEARIARRGELGPRAVTELVAVLQSDGTTADLGMDVADAMRVLRARRRRSSRGAACDEGSERTSLPHQGKDAS